MIDNIDFSIDTNPELAIIIALAMNRSCWSEVDNIYMLNEHTYYTYYKKSKLRNSPIKSIFSMETEEKANKLIGIVEKSYSDGNLLNIERIIKAINPSIIRYVKNSNTINIESFYDKYLKNKDYTGGEEFSITLSLIFLSTWYLKPIQSSGSVEFIKDKWEYYTNCYIYSNQEFELDIDSKNIDLFYSYLGINKTDKFNKNLDLIITQLIDTKTKEEMELVSNINKRKSMMLDEFIDECQDIQLNKGFLVRFSVLTKYLCKLGLEPRDMYVESNITNQILDEIFMYIQEREGLDDIKTEEYQLLVASCLMIYTLYYNYMKSKDWYLNKSVENKFDELDKLEKDLIEKQDKLNEEIKRFEKRNKQKELENKELKNKIKCIEIENKILNSKLNKLEDINNEVKDKLSILLEENYKLKVECKRLRKIHITENVSNEEKIKYINNFKIGIFGGMSSIKCLADIVENVRFYESQNQDISSIQNLDYIFVNTDFFSHSFGEKLKRSLEKYQVDVNYISGTNINLIIEKIYRNMLE